jgi:acetate kinase
MRLLVVNVGSRTVKLRVLDDTDRVVAELDLPAAPDDASITGFVDEAAPIDAVVHRVVHGGPTHRAATRVDTHTLAELRALDDLAPLHNPPAVRMIERVGELLPGLPAYACFDTAFHADLPDGAATYPVPWEWTERYGLRRYGFHGLNHAYASRRAAALAGTDPWSVRVVSCHLGGGASLAAVAGGRSVDTTMGFTPLEGLVMATRSGSIDPGLVLWLQTDAGLSADEVVDGLNHRSGLAGVSGLSDDPRALFAASDAGDDRAALALSVYVHRLRKELAAMAAVMAGVDAVVFTGGVGEHSAPVRQAATDGLGFLGIGVDRDTNRRATGDEEMEITARGAAVRTFVVPAREDLEMARQVRPLLGGAPEAERQK